MFMFSDFLVVEQVFLSPLVKRNLVVSNKLCTVAIYNKKLDAFCNKLLSHFEIISVAFCNKPP